MLAEDADFGFEEVEDSPAGDDDSYNLDDEMAGLKLVPETATQISQNTQTKVSEVLATYDAVQPEVDDVEASGPVANVTLNGTTTITGEEVDESDERDDDEDDFGPTAQNPTPIEGSDDDSVNGSKTLKGKNARAADPNGPSKKDKRRERERLKKLQAEETAKQSDGVHKCNVCDYEFSSKSKLFDHVRREGHMLAEPIPGGRKGGDDSTFGMRKKKGKR